MIHHKKVTILFMFTLFHTVQLTLQIILFFIMLVIGHTVPAIYALGHNGVEISTKWHLNFNNFLFFQTSNVILVILGNFPCFFQLTQAPWYLMLHIQLQSRLQWKETKWSPFYLTCKKLIFVRLQNASRTDYIVQNVNELEFELSV